MTKKHFIAIANVIKNLVFDDRGDFYRAMIASEIAEVLEKYNPIFDRDIFLEACRAEETKYNCGNHFITVAIYKNGKLQGYKCTGCGEIIPVNPQYQKNKKDVLTHS